MINSHKSCPRYRWILLRGLAREAGHWGEFPQLLQNALPDSEVFTIDLPGTGRFCEMQSPITMAEIARFVRAKYLEIKNDCVERGQTKPLESHLVAISLGGMVATEWLERWPEDFKSCVMINSSFRTVSPIYKRLTAASVPYLLQAAFSRSSSEREAHIFDMVSNRPELKENMVKAWTELHNLRPIRTENVLRQLLAASRYRPPAHRPPCPTLILNSLSDRMVSPSCSEAIAAKWKALLLQHPTAGHDLPLDEPEWVIGQIREFWLARQNQGQNQSQNPTQKTSDREN